MEQTFVRSSALVANLRVAEAVRELLMDPALHLSTLSNAIRIEPEVSAAVLRMANVASLMQSEPVTELDRAIAMIGTARVRVVAIQVVMRQLVEGLPTAAARRMAERVWEHSVEVACLAEAIGRAHGLRPDYCHALGLLHDLPVFVFLNSARDNPAAFNSDSTILARANQHSFCSAAQLAAQLGLPEPLVSDLAGLDHQGPTSEAVDALQTAHASVNTVFDFDRFQQRAFCDALGELMTQAMRKKDELLDLVRMH